MNKTYALYVFALLFPLSSLGAIKISDSLSVSGFGSTSITKSDNKTPIFVHREITEDTCYDCDTTFGLQADWNINQDFNTSVQLVKRPQDEWSSPEIEWAYIAYQYEDFSFKGGRLRLPMFLASEYYYVSQAYTWARPPQEVYDSILGFTFYDGVSVLWENHLSDETLLSVSPFVAYPEEFTVELAQSKMIFDTSRIFGLSTEISGFNYRLHAGYMHTKFKLFPSTEDTIINIYTLGAEYFYDEWQFMAEAEADNTQANWYISGAYNIDKLTPYITYGESHHRRQSHSITAGLRYDITYTVSVNAEWQNITMKAEDYAKGQTGQFITSPLLLQEEKDAQIITLMLNFIF